MVNMLMRVHPHAKQGMRGNIRVHLQLAASNWLGELWMVWRQGGRETW